MLTDDAPEAPNAPDAAMSTPTAGRAARARNLGWLGQTVASLCWGASVFADGIESVGDWLQLAAATAWLTANVATLVAPDR